ncbi:ABC transporter permease [Bacillus sp. es.036]|uniref:ABC transporter permease n=1 Tax=Bacillus sp. es.036 TaxID=1761764 RepID=UPI000C007488|nr:ABC transporter permease subunit [Bacillus sp. es.036]PFG13725.1 putative spermidine/putrescine transport system permease protein [Bacillus sp. es.036]
MRLFSKGLGKRELATSFMLILFIILFILPFVTIGLKSVSVGWRWPALLPNGLSLDAWRSIMKDPKLIESLVTTFKVAFLVVLLNILLAIPAARALSHYTFKGKSIIEGLLLSPILIPGILLAMGLQFTMIQFGIADKMIGVVFVHLIPTLPYAIRVMRAGYERMGSSLYEQASVLGAGLFTRFFTIALPLLLPSIRSLMLLTFVISLGQYALTAIIGGGTVITLPLLYYPYFSSSNEAVIAGFSILFALLPLLFIVLVEVMMRLVIRAVNRV